MKKSSRSGKLLFPVGVLVVFAAVAATGLVSMALAKGFAVTIAKNATVSNASGTTVREPIVVSSSQRAVYTLSGDSKSHPECTKTNGCFSFWPPLTTTAKKPSLASGIPGKLTIWHRDGFNQLVLGGHPLYRFVKDKKANDALGEGVMGFGGTWSVIKTRGAVHMVSTPITTTTSTTNTPTTSTTQTTPTPPAPYSAPTTTTTPW